MVIELAGAGNNMCTIPGNKDRPEELLLEREKILFSFCHQRESVVGQLLRFDLLSANLYHID
jgi:hypothetical protein